MSLEDRNYYGDRRTRAASASPLYSVAHENGGAVVTLSSKLVEWLELAWESCDHCTEDTRCSDHENVETGPFSPAAVRAEVCDLCDGHGKVVNPSIDCGGLTSEDFDRDPDFREEYFAGRYDITCPQCRGRNVTWVWDAPAHVQAAIEEIESSRRAAYNDFVRGY